MPDIKAGPIRFETHPSRYKHIQLDVSGPIARLNLRIQEDLGMWPGYVLKLNSYDLGVDIELADAISRLRFEHPEVSVVVLSSALEGVFCSGANIFMLGSATHGFKVNFCKFTNETRLAIEDASAHSGQKYIAAINGPCSGGGYELALACNAIYLIDDRRSSVALPEVPYLGVLPGTGGLTRVVDKRKIRRDRADYFCTLAEGLKGKKAKKWGFVDEVFPSSQFDQMVEEKAKELAGDGHGERKGIELEPLEPAITDDSITYKHVKVLLDHTQRLATLTLEGPKETPSIAGNGAVGSGWYPLRAFRELDDALLQLRFNYPEIGLVVLRTRGDMDKVLQMDAQLHALAPKNWLINEVKHLIKRVLKRMDLTAKSFFALIDDGSCFGGTLLELALAADRAYMLDTDNVTVATSVMNAGALPMGNGLTRIETHLQGESERAQALLADAKRGRDLRCPGRGGEWPGDARRG